MVEAFEITVPFVPTKENAADFFTKEFYKFRATIMNEPHNYYVKSSTRRDAAALGRVCDSLCRTHTSQACIRRDVCLPCAPSLVRIHGGVLERIRSTLNRHMLRHRRAARLPEGG